MKTNLLGFLLLVMPLLVFGQQEVVSTAGSYSANTTGSISWTLGEIMPETFENNNVILTQGFQQPNIQISSFIQNEELDIKVSVYPNPMTDRIVLEAELNTSYRLLDINGKILVSGVSQSDKQDIDVKRLAAGVYFLIVDNTKAHKIIKN